MTDTVASVLIKILKKHGIRHVFGLPAAQMALLMDGFARDPFFTYATVRHEEAAGHMAHAIGKLTDSMAVCFGTVGPGATNLVPGVAAAWADNIPMFVITPTNQSRVVHPAHDLLQNADQIALYKGITKWSATINFPERAPELVERAIHIARSGRPGPVHLEIPCDVHSAPCVHDLDSIPGIAKPRPAPSTRDLAAVADALARARRPLLYAGGGVVRSGAVEEFRALVAATGFAASSTAHSRGTVPPDYENYVGSGGVLGGSAVRKATAEADVILAIGCKFASMTPIHKPPLAPPVPGQTIIQVDIDPHALGRNVPLTLGIAADAREFLELLLAALHGRRLALDAAWLERLREERRAFLKTINQIADQLTDGRGPALNEAALNRELARLLPENAIVLTDGGQVMEWAHSFIEPQQPRDLLFNPGMGHLGFGLPMANAAKLLHPGRPVVCITGDGAMGLTGQEIETAVRYQLPVIVIVANDSAWGMYSPLEHAVFANPKLGTTLTRVDFAKVAEGYGARGERVTTLPQLAAAFRRAIEADQPTVIDVECSFTPHPIDDFWFAVIMKDMVWPVPAR